MEIGPLAGMMLSVRLARAPNLSLHSNPPDRSARSIGAATLVKGVRSVDQVLVLARPEEADREVGHLVHRSDHSENARSIYSVIGSQANTTGPAEAPCR
jgi:hypothetical protein